MEYKGIGYSNVRLPNNSENYIYTYDTRINIFPEEVFIHEFLHSLERTLQENGYDIPALHDYEKYGYKEQRLIGLKNWYEAYMKSTIKEPSGKMIGLDSIVYGLKPIHESNFENKVEKEFISEPINILEKIKSMINAIIGTFKEVKEE